MNIKEGLYYTKDHEWLEINGDEGTIGITDFAQNALGDIVYIEMPEIDEEFEGNTPFGTVESVKAASDLNMPIDGKIIEINESLIDSPELLNEEPYTNWIIKIAITDKSQINDLLSAEDYKDFCEKE